VNSLSRAAAGSLGLTAFAVAAIAGAAAGNPAERVLLVAVVAMFLFQAVGSAIGAILERVVEEHAGAYEKSRPIGTEGSSGAETASAAGVLSAGTARA
jgi:putative Mn2+ efflux pump MntP